MKILKDLLQGGLKEILGGVDNLITSKEERGQVTALLTEKITSLLSIQANIVKEEMKGNWLQKSWRPLIMLSFGFIIFYHYFLSQVFGLPVIDLPDKFWSLLEIGMGGYVIGRSAEKIIGSVSSGFGFNKKKGKDE